jgi:23S rRNA (guanosine2251-2'-O)-methyltransferase
VNEPRRVNAGGGERWIYGVHAVERRLTIHPESVRTVYLGGRMSPRRRELSDLARRHGIAVREADEPTLRKHSGSDAHQGAVAMVAAFDYCDLGDLARDGRSILILDQIHDPQNLGALLRTASAAGFAGAVLPERGATGVTGAVEKASAGAVNDIGVCRVVNLVRALDQLATAGYWRLALVPGEGRSLFSIEIPRPVALVLGGETGIRRLVREHCDLSGSIPQIGPVESLNASVAGAVAMYEVLRQHLHQGK